MSIITSASSAGCCAWMSWSPVEPADARVRQRPRARVDVLRACGASRSCVAAVGRHEQDRHGHRRRSAPAGGAPRARAGPRCGGRTSATGRSSRRRGPRSWRACPRSRSRASPGGRRGCTRSMSSRCRPARRGGARASRHASQLANAALGSSQPPSTQTMPRTAAGVPGGELQDDVAAPGLAGDDRSVEAQRRDQGGDVVGDGRHVVRAVRLGGAAVPAQVDGDGGVPALGEARRDAVPQPRVGREPVDEDEGCGASIPAPRPAATCRPRARRPRRPGSAASPCVDCAPDRRCPCRPGSAGVSEPGLRCLRCCHEARQVRQVRLDQRVAQPGGRGGARDERVRQQRPERDRCRRPTGPPRSPAARTPSCAGRSARISCERGSVGERVGAVAVDPRPDSSTTSSSARSRGSPRRCARRRRGWPRRRCGATR